MHVRVIAVVVTASLLSAIPAFGAAPNEHNCAGVFASNSASGQTISGLAQQFQGVSEFVLPDANCGDQHASDGEPAGSPSVTRSPEVTQARLRFASVNRPRPYAELPQEPPRHQPT